MTVSFATPESVTIHVVVNLVFEGVHCWPECPLPSVAFLKHPHRHLFHVRAEKEVAHTDRDVEIIVLKRDMTMFCNENLAKGGRESCEDMALRLLNEFGLASCEVLEDGENGAKVIR